MTRAAIRAWLFGDLMEDVRTVIQLSASVRADNARLEGELLAARLDLKVMRDRLRRPNQTLQQAVMTVAYKWFDHDAMNTCGSSTEEKVAEMTVYFCAGLTEEMPTLAEPTKTKEPA